MAKKAGRRVKGAIYPKKGIWYVSWMAFGKRNQRSTGIPVGTGAEAKENRKLAEVKRDEWVGAYKAEDEADVRAALAERQRNAAEVAAEKMAVVKAEENRIPLVSAWEAHPYTMSQQTRGRTKVHPLSPKNIDENRGAWEKFVRWATSKHGKKAAMQDVTADWARAYSRHLQGEGLTPQRHNKLITTAGVMFRLAGLENPFAGVDKLREDAAEHREPFTKEQVARMLDAAEGEWRGFLAVLYFTGLRRGDAALLKHENRNRLTGKIRVVMAKTGDVVEPCEHPMLTAILDETASKGKRGYLFPELAEIYHRNPAVLSQRFAAFMAKTLGELEVDADGETVFRPFDGTADRAQGGKFRVSRWGLHSFRHSFASHAAQAGIPLGRIQAWLGHSSAEITRIYTHYGDTAQQAAVMEAVALPLAGATPPKALPPSPTAKTATAGILEAVRGMVAELAAMNARNWKAKRDRALSIAALLQKDVDGGDK